MEKDKSTEQPGGKRNHLEALRSGIFWFTKRSYQFSTNQKSLSVGTLKLEVLLKCGGACVSKNTRMMEVVPCFGDLGLCTA